MRFVRHVLRDVSVVVVCVGAAALGFNLLGNEAADAHGSINKITVESKLAPPRPDPTQGGSRLVHLGTAVSAKPEDRLSTAEPRTPEKRVGQQHGPDVELRLSSMSTPADARDVNASAPDLPGRVNLNTASLVELNALPGAGLIGRAIISGRPYASADELVSRRILTRADFNRLKDQVIAR